MLFNLFLSYSRNFLIYFSIVPNRSWLSFCRIYLNFLDWCCFCAFCIIFEAIISQKGSDAWWYMKVEDLLPEKYRDKALEYEKGTDTMDVWFDSGAAIHPCWLPSMLIKILLVLLYFLSSLCHYFKPLAWSHFGNAYIQYCSSLLYCNFSISMVI